MKLYLSYVLLCLYALPVAFADTDIDFSKHQWIAPKPTDLRSPCPGLNTLANHGFLPRNGRGLTIDSVLKAGLDGFNVAEDGILLAAKAGLLSTDARDTFTLDDIKLHNLIEHDASVSRGDWALGDNLHFNETIFSTLANANPGVDYYNTTSAGDVMRLRLLDSQSTNPHNENTAKEVTVRLRESALYLSVMGDPITGVAPKEFVQIFFREERLPIKEGWKKPNVSITDNTLNTLATPIFRASQWHPNPGQCATMVLVVTGNETFVV